MKKKSYCDVVEKLFLGGMCFMIAACSVFLIFALIHLIQSLLTEFDAIGIFAIALTVLLTFIYYIIFNDATN